MWKHIFIPVTLVMVLCGASNVMPAQSPAASEPAAVNTLASDLSELQKRAEAGDASAAFDLGRAFEKGKDVQPDLRQAIFWYRKAAEKGNAKAQNALGVLYWLGDGVEKDKKQAVEWYRKASRAGEPSSMFNLGAAYYNGEGVNIDDAQALAWFLLASEAGSAAGSDAVKRSESENLKFFGDAYIIIGDMYEKGVELPQNLEFAEVWYKKAAQNPKEPSYSQALTKIGLLFLRAGKYGEARPICDALAKERRPGGAFCLGYLYQHGLGVNTDSKAAFRWYTEAANGGNPAAMCALGQMYKTGQATKVNRAEAAMWFLIAASRGSQEGAEEYTTLRDSLTDRERKDLKKKLTDRRLDAQFLENSLQESSSPVVR